MNMTGDHIIAEYQGGNLVRKYIYGPGVDFPIMMINVAGGSETRYYYYRNELGSVIALLNNIGDVVEAYSYDPFGNPKVHTSAGLDGVWLTDDDTTAINPVSAYGNRIMFTAREYDNESGLYYYRARMYHPVLGRFLQPDPVRYWDSMNLYQYCLNNPVNWIDPYGLKVNWGRLIGRIIGAVIGYSIGQMIGGPYGPVLGVALGAGLGYLVGEMLADPEDTENGDNGNKCPGSQGPQGP